MPTRRRLRTRAASLAASLVLGLAAGCAVGPDYHRPALASQASYVEGALATRTAAADADGGGAQELAAGRDLPAEWWEMFHSRPLDELVAASLAGNPNIEAAQAALRAARESVAAQRGAYYPTVAAGYSATRQKTAGTVATAAASGDAIYNLHTAQVTVSYLPDVFGLNRRQVESLAAQAEAQRFALEATYLSLTSNVVLAAIQEAALRGQLQATREIATIQAEILERFRRQLAAGQVAQADVAQQEAQLAAAEAALPPLQRQLLLQRDLLKALAGRFPSERLDAEFSLDGLELPAALPLTLPSTLVEHRPDVRAAEAQLRAASAQVGVAVADRLPAITLGVDAYGSAAYLLSDLFKAGTGFWVLAGGVTQPLLDGGALRHRELAARAAYDAAAAAYRATVIEAFQNVADALQAIQVDAEALRTASAAEHAAARSLAIGQRQLAAGDISPLALFAIEQADLQARLGLVQARANRLADCVALFQALGGGWWNRAPASADPAADGR